MVQDTLDRKTWGNTDKYEYAEWHFIEVANDIHNNKNQLVEKTHRI